MLLLHSADWQLGLKAQLAGERAEAVRARRYETAERVVALAHRRSVDLVILAGDTFDGLDVDDGVVRRGVEILEGLRPIPVAVLPGNHDPLVIGGLWSRRSWRQAGDHVHLLGVPEEVEILPGVALYPCPLTQKRSRRDPSAWIPERAKGDQRLRIGVAHGALDSVGVAENFPIAADRAERGGLDYLALGDWHGLAVYERTAYPGTPETTSFSEKEPGHVLLVELEGGPAKPRLEPCRVGSLAWHEISTTLHEVTDLDALEERIRGAGPVEELVLRLRLTIGSTFPLELSERLSDLEDRLERELFLADVEVVEEDSAEVELPPGLLSEADGILAQLLERRVEGPVAQQFAERDSETLDDARRLLRRLVREAGA